MRKFTDFEKLVINHLVKCLKEGQGPFFNFTQLLANELLTNYDFLLVDEKDGIGDAYICYDSKLDKYSINDGIYQIITLLFLVDWLEKDNFISFISSCRTHKDTLIARGFISDKYDNTNGKFYSSKMNGYYQRTSHNPLGTFIALEKFEKTNGTYEQTHKYDIQRISSQSNILPVLLKILYNDFIINYSLVDFVNNDLKSFEEIEAEENHKEAKQAILEAQEANKLSKKSIQKADISIEKANTGNKRAFLALVVAIVVGMLQIFIGFLQLRPDLAFGMFRRPLTQIEAYDKGTEKTLNDNQSVEYRNDDLTSDNNLIISGRINNSTIIIGGNRALTEKKYGYNETNSDDGRETFMENNAMKTSNDTISKSLKTPSETKATITGPQVNTQDDNP
ncbi:MAG: hypothetical protein J6X55_16300 [Victivallales bacterium]|nr:hypothetical protein [Victivallales bacterium]